MKNSLTLQTKLKKVSAVILSTSILFASNLGVFAVDNKIPEQKNPYPLQYSTGAKPLTQEDFDWIDKNAVRTKAVKVNKIGLDRINKHRKAHGLEKIPAENIAPIGEDVVYDLPKAALSAPSTMVSSNTTSLGTITGSSTLMASNYTLPPSVDNSTDPATAMYFPPIDLQQGNQCVSFATTYYAATYMNALARGWSVNNTDTTNKFSPRWTYNFACGGNGSGTNEITNYQVLLENGCAFLSDWANSDVYKPWCEKPEVWKKAINYKMDHVGIIQNVNTQEGLNLAKQQLNNGYILNFDTSMTLPGYLTPQEEPQYVDRIKDNPTTTNDNNFISQRIIYNYKQFSQGHGMTIVGYNDDIWHDFNGDGQVDPIEKGALKIANSWGPGWENNGFIWVCYKTIMETEFIPSTSKPVLWINPKPSYQPKLLAKFTLSTANRYGLNLSLGYSETTTTTPSGVFKPYIFNQNEPSPLSFDGTNSPSAMTFYLDFTDLIDNNRLSPSKTYRWYLNLSASANNPVTIKDFCLENSTGQKVVTSTPVTVNGSSTSLYTDWTFSPTSTPTGNAPGTPINLSAKPTYNSINLSWSPAPSPSVQPVYYRLEVDGNIYAANIFDTKITMNYSGSLSKHTFRIRAVSAAGESNWSQPLEVSTLDSGLSTLTNIPAGRRDMAFVQSNGKLYAIGGSNTTGYLKNVDVYDPAAGTWSSTSTDYMSQGKSGLSSAATTDNKIYTMGGYYKSGTTDIYLNKVDVFDPGLKVWTTLPQVMPVARAFAGTAVIGNKVYVIGGKNSSGALNQIDVFDLSTKTWTTLASRLNTPRYSFATAVHNNKIYIFGGSNGSADLNTIEVLDTATNSNWIKLDNVIGSKSGLSASAANGKIYLFGGNSTYIEEFDPANNTIVPKSTLTSVIAGLSTVVYNGKIYCAGGYNGTNYPTDCFEYNPLVGSIKVSTTIPSSIRAGYSVECNGKIYMTDGIQASNQFKIYDPLNKKWIIPASVIPPMPTKRAGFEMVTLNEKIYLVGGILNGEPTNTVDCYNTSTNTWEPVSSLKCPRAFFACTVANGKIYVFGGDSPNVSTPVEEYNPSAANPAWVEKSFDVIGINIKAVTIKDKTTLKDTVYIVNPENSIYKYDLDTFKKVTGSYRLKSPRSMAHVGVLNNTIYILGGIPMGLAPATPYVKEIEAFSTETNQSWIVNGLAYYGSAASGSLLSYNGVIYLFGEFMNRETRDYLYTNEVYLPTVLEYKPYEAPTGYNTWSFKSNMLARSSHASTTYDNKIYVMGGYDASYITTNTLQVFDPLSDLWTTKAGMLKKRESFGACTLSDKIYAVGGIDGNGFRTVEEYNPKTDSWIAKASLNTGRHTLGVATVNNKIYAIGGIKSDGTVSGIVEEYNPSTDTWVSKAIMKTPRYGFGIAAVNGKIYAIGGFQTSDAASRCNIVEEYNPSTDTWTAKTGMLTKRADLSASVVNGKIYVSGGNIDITGDCGVVEEYNPSTDTWATKASLKAPRYELTSSTACGKIFTFGGVTVSGKVQSVVEEYNP